MSQVDMRSSRSWRDIAQQAANEESPQRALELAQELIRALDIKSDEQMARVAEARKAAKEKDMNNESKYGLSTGRKEAGEYR